MKTILVDTKKIFSNFKDADESVDNIRDFINKLKTLSFIEYQDKFLKQKYSDFFLKRVF